MTHKVLHRPKKDSTLTQNSCYLEPDHGIQEDVAHLYFLQLIAGVVRLKRENARS